MKKLSPLLLLYYCAVLLLIKNHLQIVANTVTCDEARKNLINDINIVYASVVTPAYFFTVFTAEFVHNLRSSNYYVLHRKFKEQIKVRHYGIIKEIESYRNGVKSKYGHQCATDLLLETSLTANYLQLRGTIANELTSLMKTWSQFEFKTYDLTEIIDIDKHLPEVAATFSPYEKTRIGRGQTLSVATDKNFVAYCGYLVKNLQTTIVKRATDQLLSVVGSLIEGAVYIEAESQPNMKKKYTDMLKKVENDFFKEIDAALGELCNTSVIGNIHIVADLMKLMATLFKQHYHHIVNQIFERFLQNITVIIYGTRYVELRIAFVIIDTIASTDLYKHSWEETLAHSPLIGKATKQWIPKDNLKTDSEIQVTIETELLKHFPKLIASKLKDIAPVLKFTIKQIKSVMNEANNSNTLPQLLNGFILYFLSTSILEVVNGKPLSFDVYMKIFDE